MIQLWDDNTLAKELKNNALTERDKLFYLAALFIMELISTIVDKVFSASFPETPSWNSESEKILVYIVIYSSLILIAYKTYKNNLKGDGKSFIERFICLSVPCGNKCIVYSAIYIVALLLGAGIIGFISGITGFTKDLPKEVGDWALMIAVFSISAFSLLYYAFRMNKMFKIASGQME